LKAAVADPDQFKSGTLFKNENLGSVSWNGREHKRLFWNGGDGRFTEVAFGMGVDAVEDGRAAIFFDMDGDGDLDLLLTTMDDNHPVRLFRNEQGSRRNWLKVLPVGTKSNRQAVGALIKVRAGGKLMVRPVVAGQGYESSYYGPAHFGLGDNTRADQVEVVFPNGKTVSIAEVGANQVITIYEDGARNTSSLQRLTPGAER